MNIAIIGAAYTGYEAARYLRGKGHRITVTTTSDRRVEELGQVADRVIVMRGSDRAGIRELLTGQDIVLLTVAGGMVERDGQIVMDPELYRDAYVGTAESLVESLDAAPELRQIVFTGSWSVYGNAGGADDVDESTPATPVGPFQAVYAETEAILFGVERENLPVCVFRTGTIYGPDRGSMPRNLRAQTLPMAGRKVPFDGASPATIVHRDDVVRALEFAIDHRLSGIYNLINDVAESKAEYFGAICREAGTEPVVWVGRGSGPRSLSNRKIKDAGFRFLDPDASGDGRDLLRN